MVLSLYKILVKIISYLKVLQMLRVCLNLKLISLFLKVMILSYKFLISTIILFITILM